MKKEFISYLILPKGFKSILFKSYVYFIPFLYSLNYPGSSGQKFLWFLFIFFLFEFVINPSRYQLNDFKDYKEDQQRKYHWRRPVNEENRHLVPMVATSRFIIGTIIAFSLDIRLAYLAVLFLLLQIFYDYFVKRYSPFLAVFVVSIAYPLRSLTILYGLKMEINQIVILLLLSIFLYATYMVFQWRKNESLFILIKNLTPKPHYKFFSNQKMNSIIFINLLVFLVVFILFIVFIMEIDKYSTLIVYIASSTTVAMFSLFNVNVLKNISNQSHNILIIFIFTILTFNKFFIATAISVVIIFVIFWYHKIYVERFAINYFYKNHYENEEIQKI